MAVLWIPYERGNFRKAGVISDGYSLLEDIVSGITWKEAKFMQSETWIVLHLIDALTPLFTRERTILVVADIWNCDYFVRIFKPSDPTYRGAIEVGDFVYEKVWEEIPKTKKDKDISDYLVKNNFLKFHLD